MATDPRPHNDESPMQDLLETALTFISQYTLIFYGLGILGLLFYLNQARAAYRQMRMTPFPIEREEANANVRDALMIAVIFGAILGATFYIDRILLASEGEETNILIPIAVNGDNGDNGGGESTSENGASGTNGDDPATGESEEPVSTEATATSPAIGPTPEQSPTPTNTPEPPPTSAVPPTTAPPSLPTELPTNTPEPTQFVEETPTSAPTPIPTQPPQPTAPPVPGASCPTAGVQIASPGNGAAVSGTVAINGTADIPDFQFYKVEYSVGTSLSGFSSIGDTVSSPVQGGRLISWNTGGFPKGVYALRLTVVDISGNFPPPCTIYVILQ